MLLDLLLDDEVDAITLEQTLHVVNRAGGNLFNALAVASLDRGLYHQFSSCTDYGLGSLIDRHLLSFPVVQPVHVLDDSKRLLDVGEQHAVDVLVEIGVLEIIAVERRNDVEIVHIHGQVAVAEDAVEPRIVVGKHHRHLESPLTVEWREFLLAGLVVKVGRHNVRLEVPVTPVIFLIGIDIVRHNVMYLLSS